MTKRDLIRKPVTDNVSNRGFMDGKEAAALFADHVPDPEAADAIERELVRLNHQEEMPGLKS
jgi:hypothetical protein